MAVGQIELGGRFPRYYKPKVSGYLDSALAAWQDCPAGPPRFSRSFSPAEQAGREAELERFLDALQAELQRPPRNRPERQASHQRVTAAFVRFGQTAIDLSERHLSLLLQNGFSSIGTEMARQARRFSPEITTADVLQASRNAWTACGLQVLLGRPMRLTPAIFAYSMLYPYTDNYLDDPRTPREGKAGFNLRFGQRLGGQPVAAANEREAAIWRLVEMIEGQYPRAEWPEVFESLLAIHRAQENSLRLLRGAGKVDVLPLAFDKGGTSVLADAYLAAGSVAPASAQAIFDWGVLLQLADDLQDVQQDRADGVLTVFSQAAGREPLDGLVNRTLHFAARVTRGLGGIGSADGRPLQELIARSGASLLIRAAGDASALFTPEYIAELERHSPFRFAVLKRKQRELTRRTPLLAELFEAFLEGEDDEPGFPWLPSALMPRL